MIESRKDFNELNQIALPLIIQSIASMVIGMTDGMLVGHISADAYSAIGVAVSFMYFFAGVFGCTAVYFNISVHLIWIGKSVVWTGEPVRAYS